MSICWEITFLLIVEDAHGSPAWEANIKSNSNVVAQQMPQPA